MGQQTAGGREKGSEEAPGGFKSVFQEGREAWLAASRGQYRRERTGVYKGLDMREDQWAGQTGLAHDVFEKRGWR